MQTGNGQCECECEKTGKMLTSITTLLFYDAEGCPCSVMVSIGKCAALEFHDSSTWSLGDMLLPTTSKGELGTLTKYSSDDSVVACSSNSSESLSKPRPSNSSLRGSTVPSPESNVDAPLAVVGVHKKLDGRGDIVEAVIAETSVDALVGDSSGYGLFKFGSRGMFCNGVGFLGREPTLPEPLPRLETVVSVTSG